MSTKKIVSGTVYYGIVPKLSLFIQILIMPIITPFLSTEDYGIQGIINSYTSVLLAVAPLGLHVHLTNSYFEYKNSYNLIWGRILCLFLILGIGFGIFNTIILMISLPIANKIGLLMVSIIGSVQIFLMANNILASHLFPIVERPKPLVFTNLIASVAGIAVSFILIYFLRLGFWGLISSIAVSTVVSFLIFVKYVWIDYDIKPILEKNKIRLKRMLAISLPLVPHTLGFALLTSSARIVMDIHGVSYSEIGLFSHGCMMGDNAIIITSAISTALVAHIQRYYRSKDYEGYRTLFYLCQGVALLSSSLLCIWMPEIYKLLIHNDMLAQSSYIASFICFANVISPFYGFMSVTTFIEKRTKQILWLVFIPGLINMIICLILIPIWGYTVGIWSTIIAYWSQMFIPFFIRYYKETVGLWMGNLKKIFMLFALISSLFVLSNVTTQYSIGFKLLISVSVMMCFLVWYYKKRIYSYI